MSGLPIEPYLIELLRRASQEGFSLTIAGGLGIYLKRRWVAHRVQGGSRTSALPLLEARATEDIDVFMDIEVFMRDTSEGVARFRSLLVELGYEVHPKARYFQFIKPICDDLEVKIDLLARHPRPEEDEHVKVKDIRVGRRGHSAFQTLHAWSTSEAFAIEAGRQQIPLEGLAPDGSPFRGHVQIPHPFASLCMKLKAALDYEDTPPDLRDAKQKKHAFDVYLLTAMLDSQEFEQTWAYAQQFSDVSMMSEIREAVARLFRAIDGPGCLLIQEQADRDTLGKDQLGRFVNILGELFGVTA